MTGIEGLQDTKLEVNPDYCPECLKNQRFEELIRSMGNVLTCPSCDLMLLERT